MNLVLRGWTSKKLLDCNQLSIHLLSFRKTERALPGVHIALPARRRRSDLDPQFQRLLSLPYSLMRQRLLRFSTDQCVREAEPCSRASCRGLPAALRCAPSSKKPQLMTVNSQICLKGFGVFGVDSMKDVRQIQEESRRYTAGERSGYGLRDDLLSPLTEQERHKVD